MVALSVVSGVMPARNEEAVLAKTLQSVAGQTRRLDSFVLVDDGSTDATARIAWACGAGVSSIFRVVSLPGVPHSGLNTSRIAEVINAGIAVSLSLAKPDYFFIMGADDLLDPTYVEYLLRCMEEDPSLVISSGGVEGFDLRLEVPGGVRLIRASWWNPPGYLPEYGGGWETYPVLKAWHGGYRTRQFPQVMIHPQRPLGLRADWFGRGWACHKLGYNWAEIGYRTFNISLRQGYGVRRGITFLRGYLSGPVSESWLRDVHRAIFRRKVKALTGLRRPRPMERVVLGLEKRGVDLSGLDVLEVFGGDGSLHVGDYASKVRSLEAWEINSSLVERFKANFPWASVLRIDSYQFARCLDQDFGMVVVDNSPTAIRGHHEHFDLFPHVFDLIGERGVLVLNVIPSVSRKDMEACPGLFCPEQLQARARFYATDHPENVSLPQLVEAYRRKSLEAGRSVAWNFVQRRTYVYYLVLGYA